MPLAVAIIGGGLAGLYAARLLEAASIDFQLYEARERWGGRILSVDAAGTPAEQGFDVGPSWFWPGMQPGLAALVQELGLGTFAQHSEGDMLYERMARGPVQRVPSIRQEPPSMRFDGGAGALVSALLRDLPAERLHRGYRLKRAALGDEGVALSFEVEGAPTEEVRADRVLLALPPRLAGETIAWSPALEPSTARRWESTATWMAPHAKFVAIYAEPFWRAQGLSGSAQSMVGPLVEIHDATTSEGDAALFGFVGVPATQRAAAGEAALKEACVAQLVRIFGEEAAKPRALLLKDWAADPLTATEADAAAGGHPHPMHIDWVQGPWAELLTLGGSETSRSAPGYLAGAIEAAERAVANILHSPHTTPETVDAPQR